jgi:hypothetical protein
MIGIGMEISLQDGKPRPRIEEFYSNPRSDLYNPAYGIPEGDFRLKYKYYYAPMFEWSPTLTFLQGFSFAFGI